MSNGYSASLGNDCDENNGATITLIPVIANQQRMVPIANICIYNVYKINVQYEFNINKFKKKLLIFDNI